MAYAMTCEIVFPDNSRREEIVLYKVTAIEFEKTFKEMSSKGSLTMPRNYSFFGKSGKFKYNAQKAFQRGDAITVKFGYDGNNITEFIGYVTAVSSDIPTVIDFEDEMFRIKRLPVNFSAAKITLEELLKKIIPGYTIDALEGVDLGGVRFANTTVGAVLEKLKSTYNLYTYWQNGAVRSGKYYADNTTDDTVNFHLERNCVSNDLNYKRADELIIKIKCVSTLANGSKITVDNIGDTTGNEHTLTYYNISDKARLRDLGLVAYRKMKKDRFDGKFTAFGVPSVDHGMKTNIESSLYDDRSGTYYIDKVYKSFDRGGIRQEITIGEQI
ncbi:hypothetical protein NBRC110019_07410 [Neptunitalea chrysea]|uniref:Phage protein D n=1 Tax=Neptunitalea chrysea TaxID=1647581 RepID=A0A9W6B5I3_9FLAO|nr:hypothetical protein [Neptunitalea chrysea]GLB51702.1 hypothetical protein NBRC110019_07410 [Neptunitalea chrysea]